MIVDESKGLFIPQGNVKAVPRNSESVDIYKDPSGRPDKQREDLGGIASALESFLASQELGEHANRGLRTQIVVQKLPGKSLKEYTQAFRNAGFGEKVNDRARIARVADLWPNRFERESTKA